MGCIDGFFQLFTSRRHRSLTGNNFHPDKRTTSPTIGDGEDKNKSRTSTSFMARLVGLNPQRHTVAHVSESPSPKLTHALSFSDMKEEIFDAPEEESYVTESRFSTHSKISECFSFRVSDGELIKVSNDFVDLLENADDKIEKLVTPTPENIELDRAFSMAKRGKFDIEDSSTRSIMEFDDYGSLRRKEIVSQAIMILVNAADLKMEVQKIQYDDEKRSKRKVTFKFQRWCQRLFA